MKLKNKLLAACTAVLLGVGLSVSAVGAASAEEATPPPVSVESEATTTEAPAVEEIAAPVEETSSAPVVEEAPAPAEDVPVAPAEVVTTDAQPQAPPVQVQAKTAPKQNSVCVSHGGSDGVTPYSVTAEGLTLPAGCFFEDNGHVNIKTSVGPKNIHFESRNNQPSGQWIGKSFLPWSAFGLSGDFCVNWVQMSAFNEHFGEGGQKPVCTKPPFEVKEVCATWETKSPKADWPQTILSKDCGYVPEQRCEAYKIQFDKYWIRDAEDQAYFDGLTKLNSSADDARLEPHDYYLKIIEAKDCKPVTVTVPDLPVLPPTCDADGSLPWTSNPPAQNPNGYEFPGQGFRVYLDKAYTGPGTYVATVQKVGPGFDPAFPYGTKVTGNTKQTLTVLPATGFQSEDSTKPCYVPPTSANPKADITAVCGAADVTLTNPLVKDWAQLTASYVVFIDGEFYQAYSVEAGKSETVELTFAEDTGDHKIEVFQSGTSEWKKIAEASVPSDCIEPEPETKVEYSEWVDGEFECDATEVPQTRTKTVTEYELVDGKWVAQEPVVTTETGSRPLTEAEQEAADIECAGPQPENKIVFGEWKTGEYECGDTTVQITRTVTSTEYVREGAEWVEGESETATQTETRALTDEEIEALDCEVPPTTPEKPVTPTTPEKAAPTQVVKASAVTPEVADVLAATGANPGVTILALTGGALMVAVGALAVVLGLRARQMGSTED